MSDEEEPAPWRRGGALSSAQTALSLIRDNNSLQDYPYLLFAVIETSDPVTQARRMFPISLLSILASQRDFKLRDGDKLIVLSREDILSCFFFIYQSFLN